MKKISLIKTSKVLLLLAVMSMVFVGCNDSDDDDDEYGDWVQRSTFDGDSRSGAVSFTIGNKGYLVTGYDGDDYLNETWMYDADANGWTKVADFPGYGRSGAVGFVIDGKGYVGTGYGYDELNDEYTEFDDFYEYDPATDTWSSIADLGFGIANVDTTEDELARFGAIAFTLGSYGYVGTGDDGSEQKDFYKYDPATDTWENVIGFGGDKRQGAVVFVINDVAYIGTGTQNGGYQTDFYSFDGTSWTALTDLDDEDEDNEVLFNSGVAFTIGGKGYVGVGLYGALSTAVWEYDPADDSWEEVPNFEWSARQDASAFSFADSDRGFVLVGKSGSSYFDDVWEFLPNQLSDED